MGSFLLRRGGALTGWILSLVSGALFLVFLVQAGRVSRGIARVYHLPWIPELGCNLSFRLDGLSLTFALLISGVGALVFLYSSKYMEESRSQATYYLCLAGFKISMLGLVTAENLIGLYIFWELTTLTSFFLIGFYHHEAASRGAAWQSLIVTSVGGLAMLAGLLILGSIAGSYELSVILENGESIRNNDAYLAAMALILLGAFTKSAQFPFHFWLPNAMAAPTPVSAFLHSAAMVKAGVYLVVRLGPALGGTSEWRLSLTVIGALTMVLGAVLSWKATEIKNLLAYLTVSALGLMMVLAGSGTADALQACLVFLVAHSLYKAALFMLAGAVDHQTGTRDLTQLGGLRRSMPATAVAATLAGLSLAGLGPVLSFIAKEEVLYAVRGDDAAAWVLTGAVVLTSGFFFASALTLVVGVFFSGKGTSSKGEASALLWGPAMFLGLLGILAALIPRILEGFPLSAAVAGVLGEMSERELRLWHGFTPLLLLSMVSMGLGIVFHLVRPRRRVPWLFEKWGPERLYQGLVAGGGKLATRVTSLLQHGYLRVYLAIIIVAAMALSAGALVAGNFGRYPLDIAGVYLHEGVLCLLVLGGAVAACTIRSRLAVVGALSVVGFSIALIFVSFQAPDLAITQVLVETLILVVLVIAFHHLPSLASYSAPLVRVRDLVLAMVAGGLMALLTFGATSAVAERETSSFLLSQSVPEGKGHNVVNVTIVDFRALDTLGELTVIVTAAAGVFALLHRQAGREAER